MDELSTRPSRSLEDANRHFLGQWHRLVSTTNWEKGRIICQWRSALVTAGASPAEFSDETWSQQVGAISSQHVGRLRRVFERFGDVWKSYAGLYWSHFCAALDWDDAEMWLEGALHERWSISHMRTQRWQARVAAGLAREDEPPAGVSGPPHPSHGPWDDDYVPVDVPSWSNDLPPETALVATTDEVRDPLTAVQRDASDDDDSDTVPGREVVGPPATLLSGSEALASRFKRPTGLPDDVAEALDSFAIAILRHQREGWREISPEQVVAALDELRRLVAETI